MFEVLPEMAKSRQRGQKVPKMEKKGFTVFKLHGLGPLCLRLAQKPKVRCRRLAQGPSGPELGAFSAGPSGPCLKRAFGWPFGPASGKEGQAHVVRTL